MQLSKIYKIGPVRTLIDMNGDMQFFKSTFKVTSNPSNSSRSFELLVLNQEQLDSEDPLQFKKIDEYISGNIEVDSGAYQNHYLLLKSDTPMDCMVDIETIALHPPEQQEPEQQISQVELDLSKEFYELDPKLRSKKNMIINGVIIGIIALIAIGGIYMLMKKSKDNVPSPSTISIQSSGGLNMDLLNRLNDIQ
jgi:hypothetical protein